MIYLRRDATNPVTNTLVESDECKNVCTYPQKGSSTHSKSSSTLLSYVKPDVKSPNNEPTLTDVMNAIEKLDLEVSNVSKSYAAISQLAFDDKDLQKDIGALRKADNIHQLVDATDLIKVFYNE